MLPNLADTGYGPAYATKVVLQIALSRFSRVKIDNDFGGPRNPVFSAEYLQPDRVDSGH